MNVHRRSVGGSLTEYCGALITVDDDGLFCYNYAHPAKRARVFRLGNRQTEVKHGGNRDDD